MWHRNTNQLFFRRLFKACQPPAAGYEMAELPNEKLLRNFIQFYKSKAVIVIFHGGEGASKDKTLNNRTSTSDLSWKKGQVQNNSAATLVSSQIAPDDVTRHFVSSINLFNLGNPDEVKIALVPGPRAPVLTQQYSVITYPTSLLFLKGECVERVVGARAKELSIKSLFMLRKADRNIISQRERTNLPFTRLLQK